MSIFNVSPRWYEQDWSSGVSGCPGGNSSNLRAKGADNIKEETMKPEWTGYIFILFTAIF